MPKNFCLQNFRAKIFFSSLYKIIVEILSDLKENTKEKFSCNSPHWTLVLPMQKSVEAALGLVGLGGLAENKATQPSLAGALAELGKILLNGPLILNLCLIVTFC